MATHSGDALRNAFADLERGGIFRDYGIRNFLEGDFFRWYLSAWNDDVEKALSQMAKRLAEYDPGTIELAPENARDLLKKLYHGLLPREIRHGLGEYYTPDWLAERLIIQTLGSADLGNANKRVLDPSCGSGTFLVILIKHIKERAAQQKKNPAETLEAILKNVIGIDLNPLAVIAARTNYLLALGDLLKARISDIDIPVYQADSVLTPSRGTDLFEGDVYPLRTSAAVFRIPAVFAERSRIDALANTLDECVDNRVEPFAFFNRLKKAAELDDQEAVAVKLESHSLYKQIVDLHQHGLNGVWARIIKNNFAPLFLEPCHYIVGNPPWVNWEHLPEQYRRSTIRLWQHYSLFPRRKNGMDTILGSAKYDIAMLLTYVAADKYLRPGGKLGFVLTQSLFKTAGAGQGFRRFVLPDGTPFGPTVVEDMTELKPFEGATNRTAVAIFAKGRHVTYPVVYQYWKKRESGRAGSIGFDTPYEDVTASKITFREWRATPINAKDSTSSWITARPKALRAIQKVLGKSNYTGREGTNTGGANAVFWVDLVGEPRANNVIISNVLERAKNKVEKVHAAVELGLLFPLLRGSDVKRWNASPQISMLLTHRKGDRLKAIPETELQSNYPKTHSYLRRFEAPLRKRPALKRYFKADAPFYSIFNIGDYTFSEWKVVWREVAAEIDAAVVGDADVGAGGKVIIPDHTLILVPSRSKDEAHFLCAVLNSSPVRLAVRNYIVLHPDPHVLEHINIPTFSIREPIHKSVAHLSQQAHKLALEGSPVEHIELEIDQLVSEFWSLDDDEIKEIGRSLVDL